MQEWNSTIAYSAAAVSMLNNYLWKIKDLDCIRDLNLNEKIIEISPLKPNKKSFIRMCKGDTNELLEFLVSDDDKTGYSSISIKELKRIMLSLNMWDNGIENKIKLIQTL